MRKLLIVGTAFTIMTACNARPSIGEDTGIMDSGMDTTDTTDTQDTVDPVDTADTNEVPPFYDADQDGREDVWTKDGVIPKGMNVSVAEFNTPPTWLNHLYFTPYGDDCNLSYPLWPVNTVDSEGYVAFTLRSNTGTVAGNIHLPQWNADGSCKIDDGSLDFWGNLEAENMIGDPTIVPSLVDTYEDQQTHEVKHRMMLCLEVRGMSVIPGDPLACQHMQAEASQDSGDTDTDVIDPVETTWYRDYDEDHYGDLSTTKSAVDQPSGYVGVAGDCDDTKIAVNPIAVEVVDGIDNNCNVVKDCADSTVVKNATEIAANGLDDNCNGSVDETSSSGRADGRTMVPVYLKLKATGSTVWSAAAWYGLDNTKSDVAPTDGTDVFNDTIVYLVAGQKTALNSIPLKCGDSFDVQGGDLTDTNWFVKSGNVNYIESLTASSVCGAGTVTYTEGDGCTQPASAKYNWHCVAK